MKYFLSQSKIGYETTIGSFDIVDMTTYYKVDDSQFKTKDINVDNTQTLIELSHMFYDDMDSFWLFLSANKKINPFDLLDFSNTTVKESVNQLLGLSVVQQQIPDYIDAILTPGSIIFPATEVTGPSWDYGSTGNFSLTGGFAVIDSYNTFSKRAITKQPIGFTFQLSNFLSALIKGPTGYSLYNFTREISGTTYTGQIYLGSTAATLTITDQINFETIDNTLYATIKSEYPIIKKGFGLSPYEIPPEGLTQSIDINQTIKTNANKINSYIPNTMKASAFTKIIQNYEV